MSVIRTRLSRSIAPRLAACAIAAGLIAPAAFAQCQPQWRTGDQQGFAGANALVQAMIVADPDGAGPIPNSLIVCGQFTFVGNARSAGTAYWNPTTGWVPMGRASSSGENYYAFANWNNQLIVGGGFGNPNPDGVQPVNAAAWNGSRWTPMSATSTNTVQSLADLGGTLWALGRDVNPSNSPILRRYAPGPTPQTGSWISVGADINGSGNQLVVFNNQLYVIGNLYRTATPSTRFQVARLNAAGTDLEPLPPISGGTVWGGIVYQGELYVYGSFTQSGNPLNVAGVAKLNATGDAWIPATTHPTVASVQNITIRSAVVHQGELVVGTESSTAPFLVLSGVNGPWSVPPRSPSIISSFSAQTMAVLPDGAQIAVGGSGGFGTIAQSSAMRLAFWNRTTNTFAPPASGFSDTGFSYPFINAAATYNGELYLGGSFNGAGPQPGRSLAKFDGTTLSVVHNAPINEVTRLFADPSTNLLYVAQTGTNLSQFDGTTFTAITDSAGGTWASGVFGVLDMTNHNGALVVATNASASGGRPSYLLRRSGTTWTNMGGVEPNGGVSALTTWSSPLISGGASLLVASGSFTQIGTLPARVAAWDGSTWRALGQSTFATGYSANPAASLLVHNGDLYMSTYIISIGGVSTYPYLIRYNPTSDTWDQIPRPPTTVASGFGVPRRAFSLGGSIWVALNSTNIPSMNDLAGILRWDGTSWSNVGGIAALFPQVNDLAAYQGDLVAVGLFGTVGTRLPDNPLPNVTYNGVGGVNSVGWARLQIGNTAGPTITTQPQSRQVSKGCSTSFQTLGTTNSPPVTYQWQFRTAGGGAFTNVVSGPNNSGRFQATGQTLPTLTLNSVARGTNLEFQCIVSDSCGSSISAAATMQSCIADFDCSGASVVADIFDFLNAWFASDPRADVDGVGGTVVADIFEFLNAWFAGC
ncbi:MAG: hypothetical protein K2W85_10785 [Phycisphaerales bacterium]|nr:hypothetical protein [Phycisphaerales bacterium]